MLVLISGCDVKRSRTTVSLLNFCGIMEENKGEIGISELGINYGECLRYRAIGISSDSTNDNPEFFYSGKIVYVHIIDNDKLSVTIRVERYGEKQQKSICGSQKFVHWESIFNGSFYTKDEEEYKNIRGLKEC